MSRGPDNQEADDSVAQRREAAAHARFCTGYFAVAVRTSMMVVCFGLAASTARGASMSLEELLTAMRGSYDARRELLARSTGTAVLVVHKDRGDPQERKKVTEAFSAMGFDPSGFRIGTSQATVHWYQKGTKRRYDVMVPELEPGQKDADDWLLVPKDLRVAVDTEKGIYYDARHLEAYINRPPEDRAYNMSSSLNDFEICRFYEFMIRTPVASVETAIEYGATVSVSDVEVDGLACLKVEFQNRDKRGHGAFHISPDRDYSLVRAELWKKTGDGEQLMERYDASYARSGPGGPWLISEVEFAHRQGALDETVRATFHDVKVGVDVPDEVFTFEGLGVPPGVKLYDKRFGMPIESRYGAAPDPTRELDELVSRIVADQAASRPSQDAQQAPATRPVAAGPPGPPAQEVAATLTRTRKWLGLVSLCVAIIAVAAAATRIRKHSAGANRA